MIDPALREMALKYNVNPEKPFFPVNSLRVLYFLISDFYTNNDVAIREKIGNLIPKVEAVLSARTQYRSKEKNATRQGDWQAVQEPLKEVYALMDQKTVDKIFAEYFFFHLPIQDDIFLKTYQEFTNKEELTAVDVSLLLRARAMDSLIFGSLIQSLIMTAHPSAGVDHTVINQLSLAYQINDLVDTIVYAREDINGEGFTPFRIIQKMTSDPAAAKEFIRKKLNELLDETKEAPLPRDLQQQAQVFYRGLVGVVLG